MKLSIVLNFVIGVAVILFTALAAYQLTAGHQIIIVLAVALAVKHIAYIAINGNVFQPLRTWLFLRRKEGSKMSGLKKQIYMKPFVLFSCNLCMTVQVSFWMVMVPIWIWLLWTYEQPFQLFTSHQDLTIAMKIAIFGSSSFIGTMILAPLAMAWWRFLEFPAEYTAAMASYKETEIQLRRMELIKNEY